MNAALWLSAVSLVLFLGLAVVAVLLSASLKKRALEIKKEKEFSARQIYELAILKELGERVGYSLDIEEILRIITGSLRQFLDYTAVGFVVLLPKGIKLNVHFDKGASHSFFTEMKERMLASLAALSGDSNAKTQIEESVSGAIEVESGPSKIGSFFNIPLVIEGKLAGILTVAHEARGLYKEDDMTILYKITAEAQAAVERLKKLVAREQERVNKVREEYTSIIVHELRSPLDGIRKINELILSGKLKEAEIKEYAGMAYQSSGRMMELINDILDLSKLQAGKFEIHKAAANLREAIENRVLFYKVAADMRKIELATFVDGAVPESVMFDKEAVKQMIGNFLSNAIKFTSPGGRIVVSAFVVKPDQSLPEEFMKINMPVLPQARDLNVSTSSVCLVVSDNGSGVPAEVLPNLFQTYTQGTQMAAGDAPKGTGLGLSIVKGLAEAHGGRAGAASKDGFGSSFFFTLPV